MGWLFDGYSDDLVEVTVFVDGVKSRTVEYDAISGSWEARLEAPDGSALLVHAAFTRNGTWSLGVAPVDDDTPIPPWPINVGQSPECVYSARLAVTVPYGTRLEVTE